MGRWGNPSGEGPTRSTRPSRASGDDSFDALLAAAVSPPEEREHDDAQGPRFTRLTIGSTVSQRFVVEWFAGGGGMGAVYRCHDREADEKVALKVIRKLDDQSRFRREVSILASLSHPAIVRYVAHGNTDEGTPYLAMEWLDGEDLGRRLCRGRLSIGECLALVRGVCAGLATAHAQGFVHRDIKPSNVYLVGGRCDAVKLLDFGIAHRGAAAQTMTRTGTVLGTVGYMAPEQALGAHTPDARADLFSLGCVLFECLSGQPAFPGEHSVSVLDAILQRTVPDVCSLRPEVPTALGRLVASLLDKDREARPADALSVLRVLETIEEGPTRAPELQSAAFGPPPRLVTLVACADDGGAPVAALAARVGARRVDDDGRASWRLEASAHDDPVDRARLGQLLAAALAQRAPALVATVSAAEAAARAAQLHATPGASGVQIDALTRGLLALSDEASGPRDDGVQLRDKELAVLDAVLAATLDESTAQALLVTAPGGQGKTRLARAFAALVSARPALAVRVARGAPDPHAPFALARALYPAGASEALDEESFVAWVAARGAAGPLVICIDDAHWADLDSMQLLARALAGAADRPLLVLGFARPELAEPLRAVWRSLSAQTLSLRPLTDRAATRLVRGQTPEGTPADVLARVVALAQGSPRLLCAFAQTLSGEAGARALATALLAEQLAALEPGERAVLAAAAVLGPQADAEGISALLDQAAFVQPTLASLRSRKLMPTERYDLHCAEFPLVEEMLRDASLALLSAADCGGLQARAVRWLARDDAAREPVTR